MMCGVVCLPLQLHELVSNAAAAEQQQSQQYNTYTKPLATLHITFCHFHKLQLYERILLTITDIDRC